MIPPKFRIIEIITIIEIIWIIEISRRIQKCTQNSISAKNTKQNTIIHKHNYKTTLNKKTIQIKR